MLDFRLETFLSLCEEKSYTKTAQKLCITQPAVSQHIRYLEQHFGKKLFIYQCKNLTLTPEGEQLYKYTLLSKTDWNKIEENIRSLETNKRVLFGATLTIGEYVMPDILSELIKDSISPHLTMLVDNTETLLLKLQQGEIDFAFIEGQIDKKNFTTRLFMNSKFIPICSKGHEFANRVVNFDEIFTKRLITRESGSGTRGVLEQVLIEHNQNIQNFMDITEVGNLNVIKLLVEKGLGITFLYENAVEKEINSGVLKKIALTDFEAEREFNFVCMKGSHFLEDYLRFFDKCKEIIETIQKK